MFPTPSKNRIFQISKISKESCLQSSLMQPFISLTSDNIDIYGIINCYVKSTPNKTVSAFHTNFFKFKQSLCFKRIHRKTKIDSILKKCKSKFSRTVQEALKVLLEAYNVQVPHFSQSFITNINIDLNKQYLNQSLKDILKAFDASYDFGVTLNSIPYHNQEMISQFMLMSYKDLFEKYLDSKRFFDDCEAIREKEGEKFELLFRYVASIFVRYYSMSKGNKTQQQNQDVKTSQKQYSNDVSMTEIDSHSHKAF